jgi:hypothetical protein
MSPIFVVEPASVGLNVNLQERLAPRSLLERPSACHYSRDSPVTAFWKQTMRVYWS